MWGKRMTETIEPRAYSEETAEAVRRDHAAGMTWKALRRKYGCAIHTLGDIIGRRGAYGESAREEVDA
jgi:hypothetical protein